MRSVATRIVTGLIVVLALAGLVEPIVALDDPVSRNYNEGWNALHARAVFADAPLYPPADAFVSNNYPPLSFVVVAALGVITGDALVAGRVLALLSLLVVSACVGMITYELARCRAAGWMAGALVLGVIVFRFEQYVAMNDPQMFGHALQWLGLWVFVRRGSRTHATRLAAVLLVVAGGAVKHNLISVPMAMLVVVLLHDRRHARVFVATALATVGAASAMMVLVFGGDLIHGVLGYARETEPWRLRLVLREWWIPLAPVIGVTIASVAFRARNPRIDAFLVVAVVGAVSGSAFGVGQGVNYNVIFDAAFAACGLAAFAIQAWSDTMHGRRDPVRAVALFVVALPVWIAAPVQLRSDVDEVRLRSERVEAARVDVAWARERSGPGFSATPALAFWSGHSFAVDAFALGQAVRSGARPVSEVIERIEAHEYGWIQLRSYDRSVHLTPEIEAAIDTHYRVDRHSPVYGDLMVPRVDARQPARRKD